MAVGIGPGQARGDLGAIDRAAHDAEILGDHRDVEAPKMENFGDPFVSEHTLQIGGFVLSGTELDDVADPIARRQLHEAQAVAQRIEAQRLRIDGDAVAEAQIRGDIAFMKFDLNGNERVPRGRLQKDWCPGEDSNFHDIAATGT